jgi:hypothetical protein
VEELTIMLEVLDLADKSEKYVLLRSLNRCESNYKTFVNHIDKKNWVT